LDRHIPPDRFGILQYRIQLWQPVAFQARPAFLAWPTGAIFCAQYTPKALGERFRQYLEETVS
jgi:hypothetical protein